MRFLLVLPAAWVIFSLYQEVVSPFSAVLHVLTTVAKLH